MEIVTELNCRICLVQCSFNDKDAPEIATLFYKFTGYEIHTNDKPQKICSQCCKNLYFVEKFKKTCDSTEKLLQEMRHETIFFQLPEIKLEIKEEEMDPYMDTMPPSSSNETPLMPTKDSKASKTPVLKEICESCGAAFKTLSSLKVHIQRKHDKIRYKCDVCKKDYSDKKFLSLHMLEIHIGTTYNCQYCDKVFIKSGSRSDHIKFKHSANPRKFVCDICGKSYLTRFDLKQHLDTHSDVHAFKCTRCEHTCKTYTQLSQHTKHQHLSEAVSCKICGKTFKNKKYLRQHHSTHIDNQYFCPVCPMSYAVNMTLRQHVTKKHPEYQLPPPGTVVRKKNINDVVKNC